METKKLVKKIKDGMTEADKLQIKECRENDRKYPTTGMCHITIKQRLKIVSTEYVFSGNLSKESIIHQLEGVIKILKARESK